MKELSLITANTRVQRTLKIVKHFVMAGLMNALNADFVHAIRSEPGAVATALKVRHQSTSRPTTQGARRSVQSLSLLVLIWSGELRRGSELVIDLTSCVQSGFDPSLPQNLGRSNLTEIIQYDTSICLSPCPRVSVEVALRVKHSRKRAILRGHLRHAS
jgi:hypothetical protein